MPIDDGQGVSLKRSAQKNPRIECLGARHAAATFPSKGFLSKQSVGFLACGLTLLSAPSQGERPRWSPQISFRLQLRGSAGFAPASVSTGSACDALTFASHRIVAVYTTAPPQVCQYKLDVGQGMPGAIFPWCHEAGGSCRSSLCFSLINRVIVLSSRYQNLHYAVASGRSACPALSTWRMVHSYP